MAKITPNVQTKKLISLLVIGLLLMGGIIFFNYESEEDSNSLIETDYKDLVYLGLAPNTQSRPPLEGDIDTGIRGEYNGVLLALYSSRTWENNDYGKTFVWRIN